MISAAEHSKNDSPQALLRIHNLHIGLTETQPARPLVNGVDIEIFPGEAVGLVGESGCGKSLTALSILNLLPKPTLGITDGEIHFKNRNLVSVPSHELQQIRGNRISMIFQDPMTALNPVHSIGDQLREVFTLHNDNISRKELDKQCIDLLDNVGIASANERMNSYPHELSGGLRQRVVIAMALACKPDLLIADEPTTALDVTIQAQILDLFNDLRKQYQMALLFISHDLGVVGQLCDRIAVMYAGRIIETAPSSELLSNPRHPYTRGLINAIPSLNRAPKSRLAAIPGQVSQQDIALSGCTFANRCSYVQENCRTVRPLLVDDHQTGKHSTACHYWPDIVAGNIKPQSLENAVEKAP
jgi:peptide/nickel transport system ATP-binding protein